VVAVGCGDVGGAGQPAIIAAVVSVVRDPRRVLPSARSPGPVLAWSRLAVDPSADVRRPE
jgi:hypothetical protein